MKDVEKIYIDIGHGENCDPGAVNGWLIEHEMNKVTSQAIADELTYYGFNVKLEEGNLEIGESARAANVWGADLLLSVHHNAGGGQRGEVIHSIRNGSLKLANAIELGLKASGQNKVVVRTQVNGAGTADYFGILRLATMPAAIVEPAFIDNIEDRKLVDTPEKQRKMGKCIAESIAMVYGAKELGVSKVTYKTIDDVPDWGKGIIQKIIDRGNIMVGTGGVIDITYEMLRMFVILEREGVLK